MARRVLEKWAIFGQRAPRHQSSWFQSITILRLVFLVIEKVWQVWICSKSWCIPNYQSWVSFKNLSFFCLIFEVISFLQKLIIFLLPDFRRIQEEVSKSGILWPIAWAGMIKRFIWFFKNCAPSGHQGLLFKWLQNEKECLSRWIYCQ